MSIELKNVYKSFGNTTVLDNFSHTFPDGSFTCVMGRSGAGKTTLLRLILGLEVPDRGVISFTNGSLFSVVFQEDRLFESFDALTNVCAVRSGKAGKSSDELFENKAKELLSSLGIDPMGSKPVCEFSGGMKRRTAIARALAADCNILILDEPFQGLDEATKETVAEVIRREASGKTVIMVSHNEADADFFSAEILRLNN